MYRTLLLVVLSAIALEARATSLNLSADQQDLDAFGQDMLAAFGYKVLAPATPMGLTGFSVGGYGSIATVHDRDADERLTGSAPHLIGVTGISVEKGIPFLGKFIGQYGWVPGTSAQVWSAALQGVWLHEDVVLPSIATTFSYSGAQHIHTFNWHSQSIDIEISKRFVFVTPFAGFGYAWSSLNPSSNTNFSLDGINVDRGMGFIGVRLGFLLVDTTAVWQRVGSDNIINLRLAAGL
jgi:hypothetical protein